MFRITPPALPSPAHAPMAAANETVLGQILRTQETELLADWVREQLASSAVRTDLLSEAALRQQAAEFLSLLREAVAEGGAADPDGAAWNGVRALLGDLSRSRAQQGFSPRETATFVLSLKQPLFTRLREELGEQPEHFADEAWAATGLLDHFGLYTSEVFQRSRDEVINRQQQEVLELSTPMVKLWEGILAVPLIGTLDSGRTQVGGARPDHRPRHCGGARRRNRGTERRGPGERLFLYCTPDASSLTSLSSAIPRAERSRAPGSGSRHRPRSWGGSAGSAAPRW